MNQCEQNSILFFYQNTLKSNFKVDIHINHDPTTTATKFKKQKGKL